MLAAIARRLIHVAAVLSGVSVVVFSFLHLAPGDPIDLLIGQGGGVSREEADRLRREHGLDRPLPVQFLRFASRAARGDLGTSILHQRPVTQVIADRLPATVELTAFSLALSLIVAIPLGIASALRRGTAVDRLIGLASLLAASLPGFFAGVLLILLFGMALEWLPVSGRIDYGVGLRPRTGFYVLDSVMAINAPALLSACQHLLLPSLTLGAWTAALTLRLTRSSLIEVLQEDYILFARAKGLSSTQVALRHALRNALIPVVSVAGVQVGALLGGNMVIETVFSWPGVGRLCVDAIYARNYPLVQGIVLLYATTFVLVNLATDALYVLLDPRAQNE